jgi:hypothetical protein
MKPKRVPRLWCALQGLLPLEAMGATPPTLPTLAAEPKRPVSRPASVARTIGVRVR